MVKYKNMYTKDEKKEIKLSFWKGFKRYCAKKRINRKWVLTGVRIPNTQLKFHSDEEKAMVLFQIDHKNFIRRYEVYEVFQSYAKLINDETDGELIWDEDYYGIGDRALSVIYFKLDNVNILTENDWGKIYSFFVDKMIKLEDVYWEYKDLIIGMLKQQNEEY